MMTVPVKMCMSMHILQLVHLHYCDRCRLLILFSEIKVIIRLVKVGVRTLGCKSVLSLGSGTHQLPQPPSGIELNLAVTTFSGKRFLTLD